MYIGITPAPDRSFVAKLKEFDPKLQCVFSRRHGKFVIQMPQAIGPPAEVWMSVADDGHSFRQPDTRDLKALFGGDLHRESPEARERRSLAREAAYEEKQTKDIASDIDGATRDDKRQLANMYNKEFNMSKVSTFRRIETKAKGYKVIDKRRLGAEGVAECHTGKELPDHMSGADDPVGGSELPDIAA